MDTTQPKNTFVQQKDNFINEAYEKKIAFLLFSDQSSCSKLNNLNNNNNNNILKKLLC